MRFKQFLNEAEIAPGIDRHLKKLGYKKLGRGVDQSAWLEPGTGLIMKIFGTRRGTSPGELTDGQRAFKKFADYCMANKNNPFLPQFLGWETFEYKDENYLQIKCERLFEFSRKDKTHEWAHELENIAVRVKSSGTLKAYLKDRENPHYGMYEKQYRELMTHLGGEDKLKLLWDTIVALRKMTNDRTLFLDLHAGNFMLASDGHIVVSDPFFTGY